MLDINSNIAEESGCLANNLPLKVMRIGIENKGVFLNSKAGALYYFTGKKQNVTVKMEDNTSVTYTIPVTAVIDGPDSIASNKTYGIQFMFDGNNSVIGGKLVEIQ